MHRRMASPRHRLSASAWAAPALCAYADRTTARAMRRSMDVCRTLSGSDDPVWGRRDRTDRAALNDIALPRFRSRERPASQYGSASPALRPMVPEAGSRPSERDEGSSHRPSGEGRSPGSRRRQAPAGPARETLPSSSTEAGPASRTGGRPRRREFPSVRDRGCRPSVAPSSWPRAGRGMRTRRRAHEPSKEWRACGGDASLRLRGGEPDPDNLSEGVSSPPPWPARPRGAPAPRASGGRARRIYGMGRAGGAVGDDHSGNASAGGSSLMSFTAFQAHRWSIDSMMRAPSSSRTARSVASSATATST